MPSFSSFETIPAAKGLTEAWAWLPNAEVFVLGIRVAVTKVSPQKE